MATPPDFTAGQILTAAQMDAIGLWLVKTQTVGTGVSSVAVTSAFTADFANYRIIYSGGTMTALDQMAIQLGSSTTAYYGTLIYASATAGVAAVATNNNNVRADWIGGASANQAAHASVDLFSPNLAAYTKIRNGQYAAGDNFGTYNGEHRVATAYTGFTLFTGSGTMTGGTIRVYGYRD